MPMKRPYVVVPDTASKRYKKSTHAYGNNAFLEAERIAQESNQIVRVYKREGKALTPYTVVNPKDELALLLGNKRRLEKELSWVNQKIEAWEKQHA